MIPGARPLDAAALAALAEPRGKLREGLSALRNFAELSRSLRVGPKALGSVLPDVAEGCAPLRDALQALLAAVAPALAERDAGERLAAELAPRIDGLERELSQAAAHPLNAKARLALEQQVSELTQELDCVRSLLELLIEALSEQPLRALVAELVRESVPASAANFSERIALELPAQDFEADVRPRLIAALLGVAVALVARHGSGPLHVRLRATSDGFALDVRAEPLAPAEPTPPAQRAHDRGALASALPYLESAVTLAGGALAWQPENARLGLVFPAGHAMGEHA